MSTILTSHDEEQDIKCSNCGENMYEFSPGVLKCTLCGATDDAF